MLQAMLLYPPITDSTSPYHSLIYLASFARSAGFTDIAIRDTNIEALNFCARPDVVAAMTADWRSRRRELGAHPTLSGAEQLEYFQLVRAEAVQPDGVAAAIATLRDPVRFYRYDAYKEAVARLTLWLETLSCSGWPGQFEPGGHSLRRSGWLNLSSVTDLTNERLLERLVGPFVLYFESVLFPQLQTQAPRVIGINVTYTSQLPYALWLVRRIRRVLPDAFIVCGGTEVTGVWKYLRGRSHMIDLFAAADACVIGEGETAFVRLLEEVLERRPPAPIENVVRLDTMRRAMTPPPGIRYENLERLPLPEYQLMDSSLYFSPHPIVYYSPTRGCYWNKCTFCDYGLNFGTPTSPWRQVSVERSVAHLRTISAYSRYVYLSVDVLAPGRLFQLAEAVAAAGIDIRWAAEIRLERFFNETRCRTLRQSGCVAVSVGFESGSQRILDLIDKGVALPDVETTIRNFSTASIAVQMMGFTGFPTETHDEAMASVDFLTRTGQWWTTSALGEFLLTPGAIVARTLEAKPGDLRALDGDDIVRTLQFSNGPERATAASEQSALRAAKRRLVTADFDRPFAGGIDAAHSIFYYDRYGRQFPNAVIADAATTGWGDIDDTTVLASNGTAVSDEHFDVLRIPDLVGAAQMGHRATAAGHSLDHAAFAAALVECTPMPRIETTRTIVVRADGVALPCPPGLTLLLDGLRTGRTLRDAEAMIATTLAPADRAALTEYTRALTRIARSAATADADDIQDQDRKDISIRTILLALLNAQILCVKPESSSLQETVTITDRDEVCDAPAG
jgi:hypothetical protein